MSQNKNDNLMPFGPMGAPMMNLLKQVKQNAPKGAMPLFPMPDYKAMNEMAAQVVSLKMNQMSAYAYQMTQTSANMLKQLYTEHTAMVKKAAEQDMDMMKQIEKAFRQEDKADKADDKADDKPAAKPAKKPAAKTAAKKPAAKKTTAKAAAKPAAKTTAKAAAKPAAKPAAKKAAKPAAKPADNANN